MKLTEKRIQKIGFKDVSKDKVKVYHREEDNVILYEFSIPSWYVQLNGWDGPRTNLMLVTTEEELQKTIDER